MPDPHFPLVNHIAHALDDLATSWRNLGIDPDDFVKCATCSEYIFDEDGAARDCACDRDE